MPSSCLDRKPILRKKTASETILQWSLSQHTLLQHTRAILKAQEIEIAQAWAPPNQTDTNLDHFHHRTASSYSLGGPLTTPSSSGMVTPDQRRHIHFKDEVVQCIAIEAKEDDKEKDESPVAFEDESSDEGAVMMPQLPSRASTSNQCTRRSSFSSERKTIAPLPSTTLKYCGDVPETQSGFIMGRWSFRQPSLTPSPTSSAEALRPSQRLANDLVDEDTGTVFVAQFASHDDYGYQTSLPLHSGSATDDEDEDVDRWLQLNASSMFKPFDEDEDEDANTSMLRWATVMMNMARDIIAHVTWMTGW